MYYQGHSISTSPFFNTGGQREPWICIAETSSRTCVLGEVLTEQQSEVAFETVRTLRTMSLDYRDGAIEDRKPLKSVPDRADDKREFVVARAQTAYFELINLIEKRECIRVLREQSQAGVPDDGLEKLADGLWNR